MSPGNVEAMARGVGRFQVGDAVFGDLSVCGFLATFAEFTPVPPKTA